MIKYFWHDIPTYVNPLQTRGTQMSPFPGVFCFSVITGPSTFLWASHLWVGRRQTPIFGCGDRIWFLRGYHTKYNDIGTVLFKVFTLVVYNAQQWPWSPVFSVSLGRASRPFPYWNLTDTSQFSQTICPVSSSDHRQTSWFEAAVGSSDRDGLDQGNCLCTMDKPSLAYNLLDIQPLLTHGSVTHTVALSLDVRTGVSCPVRPSTPICKLRRLSCCKRLENNRAMQCVQQGYQQ